FTCNYQSKQRKYNRRKKKVPIVDIIILSKFNVIAINIATILDITPNEITFDKIYSDTFTGDTAKEFKTL
ncbi:hypothetical protein BM535_22930, partial [Clostridioides difficile]